MSNVEVWSIQVMDVPVSSGTTSMVTLWREDCSDKIERGVLLCIDTSEPTGVSSPVLEAFEEVSL